MVLWNVLTSYHQLQHSQGFLLCIIRKVVVTREIIQIYPILGSGFVCLMIRYAWAWQVLFFRVRTRNIMTSPCFRRVVHHIHLSLIYHRFKRAIFVSFLSVLWQERASSTMVLHVLCSDQLEIVIIIVFQTSMRKSMRCPSIPDIITLHPEVTRISFKLVRFKDRGIDVPISQ